MTAWVIDSSVLVWYLSREPGWEAAREALLEPAVTLPLAVKEAANALWKKARRGELDPDAAEMILKDLAEGVIPLEEQEPLVPRAYRIAVQEGITVYDALFIALAERLHAGLITADRRQAEAAERIGVEVRLLRYPPETTG